MARRAYTSPGAFLEGLQPTVIWLGPGLVALGLVGIGVRAAQLARCWRVRGADLLIALLIALVLGYVNKSAGWFPKYQVALVPLLAILAAPLVAHAVCARAWLGALVVLAAIASGLVELRLVRDAWALERTYAIDVAAGTWLLGILIGAVLLGTVAGGVLLVRRGAGSPLRAWHGLAGPAALAALAGLALGWSLGTNLIQANAAYSTDYWYGTTGTLEAAAWVDGHLQPGETYVAAKEVAIRSSKDQRYVDQDNIVYFMSAGRGFAASWAGEPLRAMVVWQREPYVADLLARAAASAGFRETARFGDYVVYEPAGSGS